jgi:hypothetical protein
MEILLCVDCGRRIAGQVLINDSWSCAARIIRYDISRVLVIDRMAISTSNVVLLMLRCIFEAKMLCHKII